MSYHSNITQLTAENDNFRRVLFTGRKSQLVIMNIPPGGEVGEEMHANVEQTLYFQSGVAESIIDGKTNPIRAGEIVIVTPGTRHNFRNTGRETLKIFTLYAPPNHIDGRIHRTKADADADTEDEEFGENAT